MRSSTNSCKGVALIRREKSGVAMQELPVRQHLKNSFGPLLKDALFEMRKR